MGTHTQNLATADFDRLRSLIHHEAGIHLGAEKKTMLEIRLRRRWKALQQSSCAEYCEYVFSPAGRDRELVHLIDAVTTNKTDFFREAGHFEFLVSNALPELAVSCGARRKILVWSAGCATGEEPYTLAIVLSEYARSHPGFQFSVLATDISTAALETARKGIYRSEVAAAVPPDLRRKFFMRSRQQGSDFLRVVPEVRAAVEFRRINLMDTDFTLAGTPDIVFCRNVIIYFDRPTQFRLLGRLSALLRPGGYWFSGHSESLQGLDLPLAPAGAAVYRRLDYGLQ